MLKNKFKIITLLIVMILCLTIPVVRAENQTANQAATTTDTTLINENSQNADNSANTTTNVENTMKKGDVYLTGDNVTVDYIVDGNLFVFANTVTINSQIGGDVFAFAGTVNVGEQGYIFSNLFTCAKDVNISGVVYDLYTFAQNVTINGYVYRDIRVGSNSLNINGVVGRNAFVESANINFATAIESNVNAKGIINGNFNYTAKQEFSIPEGSVAGQVNFTQAKTSNTVSIQTYILSLGRFLATAAIIWLVCLWLAPKFLNNTNNFIPKKLPSVIGYGILVPILAIIAFVILVMLGITSSIALLELGLLFLLLAISSSIFVIAMNNLVCNKLKIQKNIGIFGMLIASATVLWLVTLIPYVGGLVSFAASIIGLGLVVKNVVPSKKKEDKKVSEK